MQDAVFDKKRSGNDYSNDATEAATMDPLNSVSYAATVGAIVDDNPHMLCTFVCNTDKTTAYLEGKEGKGREDPDGLGCASGRCGSTARDLNYFSIL